MDKDEINKLPSGGLVNRSGVTDVVPRGEDPFLASNSSRVTRIGLLALVIGFGGFLVWAAFAPLDEGVPASGTVSIDTKRKAVQHLTGGIVQQVLVKEGDEVKEGQLLIKLDEATARANYEAVRQRYLGYRAMQARLQAEQTGRPTMVFHPDLEAARNDPLIQQQIVTQEQLFNSRRASLAADLQSFDQSIQGQQGLLVAYRGMMGSRREQQALLKEQLDSTRALVSEGYAPRNRQLELDRTLADLNASLTELEGNIARTQFSITEQQQKKIARQQEYRKEVEGQLADVTREVQSDAEKIIAVRDDLRRTEIRAPATGQVVGLAFQTVGGVIPAGQKVMDIVPQGEELLLEAHVAPHMIDRVKGGEMVDVRFSSFSHSPQLVVQGRVHSISGDLLTDAQGNNSYYLARVAVTPEGMKALGKRELQPGMPVEVVFKTGERSMLTYMLHPLVKRIAASMTEE